MATRSAPPRRSVDLVARGLDACPVLDGLTDAERHVVRAGAKLRHLLAGEATYRAGDRPDAAFVVVRGRIAARIVSARGEVADLTVVGEGTLFGHVELLVEGPRTSAAVAVTATTVAVVPERLVRSVLLANPLVMLAVARDVATMVTDHVGNTASLLFLPAPARIAAALLERAGEGDRVDLDGSQTLLAQRLGLARQTANRGLRALAARRLIDIEPGGRVVLLRDRLGLLAVVAEAG